jgi:rhamnulokinase
VGEIVRCCLESLALKYRYTIEGLERLSGTRFNTIRIVGGGSQNHLLNQFTADACGKSVVAGPVEATALGNIMVQAIASGHLATIQEGREAVARSVELKTYEPHSSQAWNNAYERFLKVIAKVF